MALPNNKNLAQFLNDSEWLIEEKSFEPSKVNFFETIFTTGNGYQGTRGALEEGFRGSWPSTYIAGVFDHHDSTVVDLVSAPDWIPLRIYVDGVALNLNTCKATEYRRKFDLKQGILYRHTIFEDPSGRRTRYESIRFVSYSNQHLAAMRVLVSPENYDGQITVESALEGDRRNLDRLPQYVETPDFPIETKWEKWAKSKHLQEQTSVANEDGLYLEMKTLDRDHHLGYAASLKLSGASATRNYRKEYEKICEVITFPATEGNTYQLDKLVTIGTSRDMDAAMLQQQCTSWLQEATAQGFDALLKDNAAFWASKWESCDCILDGDAAAQQALRFNIYHVLISANENDPKVNIGAKSLSGEGYKGHVFWDTEIFLLPFFIYTQPETAKALLLYRYHCLVEAQKNATTNGFKGSQYPWESADTGAETTPKWTHDGKHRIWTGEEEIHITADVAYGVLTYLTATDDWPFFLDYGAEMLFNTARFWESRLEYQEKEDRYELNRVIGPDEFHEHVDNNVFTNWLAKWNLQKAVELFQQLGSQHADALAKLMAQLQLTEAEVQLWQEKAEKIYILFDPKKKLIEQYEDYFKCKEVAITEWDANEMPIYPEGYDHFNAQETTLVKQPDVVMLMYVLPDEFDDEIKRINYDYYEQRTMHKSSLSPSIHSIMGIEVGDTSKALQYFQRSAFVDLVDNQGNTDMGMHAASAGGTWMCLVFGFGGFRVKNKRMTFKPWLPKDWNEIQFKLKWRGDSITVKVRQESITFFRSSNKTEALELEVKGNLFSLLANQNLEIAL
ncbi:MAG: kojibiose phosphorylase [Polaribacter sp.]|jgi:kojibiose phosphorylase